MVKLYTKTTDEQRRHLVYLIHHQKMSIKDAS